MSEVKFETMSDSDFASILGSSEFTETPADKKQELPTQETEADIPLSDAQPEQQEESTTIIEDDLDEEEINLDEDTEDESTNEPDDRNEPEQSSTDGNDEPSSSWDSLSGLDLEVNGTKIKLDTPQEAEQLIKRGLEYNTRINELRNAEQAFETLKAHKLNDPDTLNLMIECRKGNKEAIAKLLADTGVDPFDLQVEESKEYTPDNHQISAESIKLDKVLDQVSKLPKGLDVITMVGNDPVWSTDGSAELIGSQAPEMLTELAKHKESGVFDEVMNVVTKERAVDNATLRGVCNAQAYGMVYNYLRANNLLSGSASKKQPEPPKVNEEARNAKRKMAAVPNSNSKSNKDKTSDDKLVGYTDEQLLKELGSFY